MFVTLEGPDGCGKTTLLQELKRRRGLDWFFTQEPCPRTPLGQILRDALDGQYDLPVKAQLGLFTAARAEHIELLHHGLNRLGLAWEDAVIVCDRYTLSTLVYQTLQGWSYPILAGLCKDFPVPDITIVLDTHAEVLCSRRKDMSLDTAVALSNSYKAVPAEPPWTRKLVRLEARGVTAPELADRVEGLILGGLPAGGPA